MALRIGKIDYANCIPIFSALLCSGNDNDYELVYGVPSGLNQLLAKGELDVSPSSSIEYGKHFGRYLFLPDLSISAIGPVRSVLLVSTRPLADLDRQAIALTTESDTSVNLLKILLSKAYSYTNRFERTHLAPSEALSEYSAMLLIGDAALKTWLEPKGYFLYDLGELWHKFTGLPFVFALWIVNRQAADTKRGELLTLSAKLTKAKEYAYSSYAAIAAGCRGHDWISQAELVDYWQTISYDLTPEHIKGLQLFYNYAAEMGILNEVPELSIFRADMR
jgi:chorismate dehydratase